MVVYDAFVSYSHAKDKPIAAALQSVIQRLGKPWYQRRALRVFRDDTSLSATPQLWPSIEQALSQSRFLILLASPEAAASPWVNKEVAYWLEHKSTDTLLIAVTDGPLVWDNAVGDFVWREGMPLPPMLTGRFAAEPKWVDLTAYRDGADARDSRFIEAGADLAAAIRGMPKDDLLSQEVRQQRRALRLAWGAAASLLILASLAGWQAKVALDNERAAIEQQRIAQAQRDRAERTLAAATNTANGLIFELAREFRDRTGMPIDLVQRLLERAQNLQQQLAEAGETNSALRESAAIALVDLMGTYLALGDTTKALATAQRARDIMGALAAANPSIARWQRSLAVCHEKVGNVLMAIGRREEALAEYRLSRMVTEKLVATDPANTEWQRDLSVNNGRIGDVLVEAGQRDEALMEYRLGLAIREKLVAVDSGNAEWRRDLSVSYIKIGDVLAALDRPYEALAEYRKGVSIHVALADAEPNNTLRQRDLSVSRNRIGNALLTIGQLEQAIAEYRGALAIIERLSTTDPRNTEWQRDLSFSYDRVGNILAMMGKQDAALAEYRRSLEIVEKLVGFDPGNVEWKRDLSDNYFKVGSMLAVLRRWEEALAAYRTHVALNETLSRADPGGARWQRNLLVAHGEIGDALRTLGRREDALAEYRKGLAIAEKFAALDPGNAHWQFDLATNLFKVSTFLEPARARPLVQRAIAILDPLARAGRLTAEQRDWPGLLRELLATFPPEPVAVQ